MFLNKAIIIGNLTRDPELKAIPSGAQVTNMGVATNRVWVNKEGQRQEDVEFHNVVVFGRQAETSAQYLKKGASVLIEGRLRTQSWEADGVKKYKTEIVAERVQFGPRKDGANNNSDNSKENYKQDDEQQESPKGEGIDYPKEEINPEDIPF